MIEHVNNNGKIEHSNVQPDKRPIMERKTVKLDLKEIDEEEGTFTAYAATFSEHPDSYNDIIDPGAFKKTIKEGKRRIKILWNHDTFEPIGKPIELSEDETGLLIKGKLSLGVQRAREVLSLMRDGVINEMSIGFNVVKEKMVDGVRHLQEIKLYDTSPVSFAANTEAVVLGVKTEDALDTGKLGALIDDLQALLGGAKSESEPDKSTPLDDVAEEAARLESVVAGLKTSNDDIDVRAAEKRIDAILDQIREKE